MLDGNIKNHRDVCLATYAGYVEYKGLPGKVQTGCPNTPAHKSPYCSLHKPVIAVPQRIQVGDDDHSSVSTDASALCQEPAKEEPVRLIV